MASIELLDLGDFYNKERETVATFGELLYGLVGDPKTKNMLVHRNLHSAIQQYGVSYEKALESADTQGYLSSNTLKSGSSHYVIVDSSNDELLGLANLRDNLTLQIRKESKRSNFIKRLIGHSTVRSELIEDDYTSIDAWVKPSPESREQLAQAYIILKSEVTKCWTTEPVNSIEATQAIQLAGLEIVLPPKYYDCEVKNQKFVPLSNLFIGSDLETEITQVFDNT